MPVVTPCGTPPKRSAFVDAVRRHLLEPGLAVPVRPDEGQAWNQHALASLLESCFAELVAPESLSGERWTDGRARLGGGYLLPDAARIARIDARPGRFWLLEDGAPIGTIELYLDARGFSLVPMSSLYVRPGRRRRGTATRALTAAADAAVEGGHLGLSLGTEWVWQDALRFYFGRGLWVEGWHRDLRLAVLPGRPKWWFEDAGDEARMGLESEPAGAAVATRRGDAITVDPGTIGAAELRTFFVRLALAGWPLVRSAAEWKNRPEPKEGRTPESLAAQILEFEADARRRGYLVATATDPSLERWAANHP